jgi:hypothetical protein
VAAQDPRFKALSENQATDGSQFNSPEKHHLALGGQLKSLDEDLAAQNCRLISPAGGHTAIDTQSKSAKGD